MQQQQQKQANKTNPTPWHIIYNFQKLKNPILQFPKSKIQIYNFQKSKIKKFLKEASWGVGKITLSIDKPGYNLHPASPQISHKQEESKVKYL